ncbi:hypothetical protein HYDPIDRAFT_112011 [Hydnomerulius pinastri MD-312]|uniref:Uncharacterized protein n=1 Tax=Hydnomerulius pinastri MD-312 TaxID=994086 RepID=A0A0C9W9X0_9AGAM|nr:hypothetical protein HYDPIDRAFT_112011 [Hydnomerulius pinastri MD-312]
MSPTPSAILTDALASFNKAANIALTTAQEQSRKDVTQATTDTREARRERDEAVKALNVCRLEEQAWKQEAGVWKAAADQAELTIKHHLETIAQLRQEATQWKNQCLRLEESSRQEAISWKEQFLRVEQERYKLAQRVDELISDQLSGAQTHVSATPFTPMVRYSTMGDLSVSTRLHQPPALDSPNISDIEELPPSKSTSSKSRPSSSTTRVHQGIITQLPTPTSENQRVARQRAAQEPPTSARASGTANGERQVLIRRVKAIVEIPVKEESVDGEVSEQAISASSSTSASTSSAPVSKTAKAAARAPAENNKAATRVKRKMPPKRTYVEIDEDEESAEEGEESEASRRSGADFAQAESDDDDELLMGVEENRKEVYGIKRIGKPSAPPKTPIPPKTPSRAPTSNGKKRKVAPSTTDRKKSRTAAKSRA